MMLEPKEETLDGKTYVLSKFPATVGRAILLQYPTSAIPKLGDYATNEALMLQIMKYVAVAYQNDKGERVEQRLASQMLVDQHVKNAETLIKLEFMMMQHNFAFFGNGGMSSILERVMTHAAASIRKILTDLSPLLSEKGGQR